MHQLLERGDYLGDEELRALLRAARERRRKTAARDYALLAVLATTAMRPQEALNLTVDDLTLTDHDPRIRVRRLKKRREGGVLDDVPITRGLARVLRRYVEQGRLAAGDRVFPMSVRNLEELFKHYLRLAGIRVAYRLYTLRHTALTRAYQVSRDLKMVQELAGHASIRTTLVYTHVDPREKRRIVELAAVV